MTHTFVDARCQGQEEHSSCFSDARRMQTPQKGLAAWEAGEFRHRTYRVLVLLLLSVALVAVGVLFGLNTIIVNATRNAVTARRPSPDPGLPRVRAFLVDTPICRIPDLDPWNPETLPFKENVSMRCTEGRGRPLVASNLTALFVLEEALPDYGVRETADLHCCYQPFYPASFPTNNRGRDEGSGIRYAVRCTAFHKEALVGQEEFVRVRCRAHGWMVYEDFHAFVPRKAAVEERCRRASSRSRYRSPGGDAPSVLVLGLDTVSRLNFHRQMPRTAALLQRMGAVEMLGYHKVADTTFPNLMAAFTGHSEQELRNTCWPTDRSSLDKCRTLWDDYRDAGYRTAFAEDGTVGALFKKGLVGQHTDYYGRPFMRTLEDTLGHKRPRGVYMCAGSRMVSEVLLQYAWKFAMALSGERSFGIFWGRSLSHGSLNNVSLVDGLHVRFFTALEEAGVLRRSVVALMSDNGLRYGLFRDTYYTQLEDRLPLLLLLLPDWFRQRYAAATANVERNARRLTSHFDLHEALRDLARPAAQLSQQEVERRSQEVAEKRAAPGGGPRGISLFLEVPPARTCQEAGIHPHWCTCHESQPADRHSDIAQRAGKFIVHHVNQMLSSFHRCAQLTLSRVQNVKIQLPANGIHMDERSSGLTYYILVVRTEPGSALFQATVRHVPTTSSLDIAGFVGRINAYGAQSACIDNKLKLYCYCIDNSSRFM